MKTEQGCDSCRFAVRRTLPGEVFPRLICIRLPPTMVAVGQGYAPMHPIVEPSDVCWEWKEKHETDA